MTQSERNPALSNSNGNLGPTVAVGRGGYVNSTTDTQKSLP